MEVGFPSCSTGFDQKWATGFTVVGGLGGYRDGRQ